MAPARTSTTTKANSRSATKTRVPKRPAATAKGGRDAAPLADIGVASPYALAEMISRRHIDWDSVPNRPALLEDVFQTPYQDLFDPASGSPLYIGQQVQSNGSVVRSRPDFDRERLAKEDASIDFEGVRTMADLVERFGSAHLAEIPIRSLFGMQTGLHLDLGETMDARQRRFAGLFDLELIDILFPLQLGYHPPGYTWQDTGSFFNEATEFFDPVQGGVGDCYFIAAMSSVAWAMPHVIVDRNRATGVDNQRFKHQIGFYGPSGVENVEVTDNILVSSGGYTTYATSKEAGEIWPAVYEKAYAKWRLGEVSDFPAIPNIAGGDPSMACAALTGLADYRNWHNSFTAPQILQLVKNHTTNGRTTTPMISWTYGSGPEGDVAYRDANVVAGHAYSVLGWLQRTEWQLDRHFDPIDIIPRLDWPYPAPGPGPEPFRGFVGGGASSALDASQVHNLELRRAGINLRPRQVDYVVLRNPWGYCEGTGPSVASGDYRAVDTDWWRTIPLGVDGVFAMEINAYHRYFAGTGGAH
ncbi:MAG: C2 family cysteine protease [Aquihabitans sp.]